MAYLGLFFGWVFGWESWQIGVFGRLTGRLAIAGAIKKNKKEDSLFAVRKLYIFNLLTAVLPMPLSCRLIRL